MAVFNCKSFAVVKRCFRIKALLTYFVELTSELTSFSSSSSSSFSVPRPFNCWCAGELLIIDITHLTFGGNLSGNHAYSSVSGSMSSLRNEQYQLISYCRYNKFPYITPRSPIYMWTLKYRTCLNPLTPTVIQKLLEIIGGVRLCPSCSFATALDSDINQTTGSGGHLSMWENRCMHAAVCLLRAGQPRSAGDAAKLGQFIGQFSWVTGDPIGVKGLRNW